MPATIRIDRDPGHIYVSTKPVWGPVSELVDLRYRPEVNTIEALTEPGPTEHAPFAEPIWTTTSEVSGLGVDCKSKIGLVVLDLDGPAGVGLRPARSVSRIGSKLFKLQVHVSGIYIQ